MKTSELQGVALDWAVARAAGREVFVSKQKKLMTADYGKFNPRHGAPWWYPSTNWAQGGPIIAREKIGIDCDDQGVWFASYNLSAETAWGSTGLTPLIAAMRCYVASKLGDEVDVPERACWWRRNWNEQSRADGSEVIHQAV
jgi:hypothetical protein